MFAELELLNWRQFRRIHVTFHPRLTILTGANGAGKTTILHLLNRHWGWNVQYVSTPRFTKKGLRSYWAGFWGTDEGLPDDVIEEPYMPPTPQVGIGHIAYTSGERSDLSVPVSVSEVFQVNMTRTPTIAGVFVPSHRPAYFFQKVEAIPTHLDAKEQLFNVYVNELRNRWSINYRVQSPSHKLKQALMGLAVFGYGNPAVEADGDALDTFQGFENILRIILPPTLGFRRIIVKAPDVLLDTSTGRFAFDAISGGVAALIDLGWQIYMSSRIYDRFVVVIDEPEAHLHPELQRRVLPSFLTAFPQAQFIVATHNPFVVTSTPDSHVFVLSYDETQRVISQRLDLVNKAGSSNDILRDVLGLDTAVPLWVQDRLEAIVSRFTDQDLDPDSLREIRAELITFGLDKYVPETQASLLERRRKND